MSANAVHSRYQPLADLGNEIRQLRKMRPVTLQQLALATGKSLGYLSQVERNPSKPPVATLQDISEALAVHIGWFCPQHNAGSPQQREQIVRNENRRTARIRWWSEPIHRLPCANDGVNGGGN